MDQKADNMHVMVAIRPGHRFHVTWNSTSRSEKSTLLFVELHDALADLTRIKTVTCGANGRLPPVIGLTRCRIDQRLQGRAQITLDE